MHVRLMTPLLLGGLLVFTLSNAEVVSGSAPDFIRRGAAGVVVEHFEYALAQQIADRTVCAAGLTPAPRKTPSNNPSGSVRGYR